jgi:hypothetical protein
MGNRYQYVGTMLVLRCYATGLPVVDLETFNRQFNAIVAEYPAHGVPFLTSGEVLHPSRPRSAAKAAQRVPATVAQSPDCLNSGSRCFHEYPQQD